MTFTRKITLLSSLAALLIIVGCGPSGDSFRLSGTIEGMQNGEIYIYNTSLSNARFDTIAVKEGKFFYGGTVGEPTPYHIVFSNALEQAVFIGPGDEISYKAVSNDLNNYTSSGSKENKLLTEFRSTIRNASYSDIQSKARQFVSEHSESYVALYILERYFLQNPQTSYDELDQIVRMLEADHSEHPYYTYLSAKAKAMKSVEVGDGFPDIPMQAKTGKTEKLWSSSKASAAPNARHTLFVLWATWIPTSYELIAKVRKAERDYSTTQLRIVAYSIDNEFDRWNNMTRYDSLTHIEHFCDSRAFDSPGITQTRTSTIPTYYIIDNYSKKVVAKGTEVRELSDDIEKILGKKD